MLTIASFSLKGGVGKTTTAVNLAFATAAAGRTTLLVDLDAQGAASFYFRIRPDERLRGQRFFTSKKRLAAAIKATDYERLDLLPAHRSFRDFDLILHRLKHARKRLARVLRLFSAEYDVVILDCPPSTSLLSESICAAADIVLVPMIPTTLCRRTCEQLRKRCAEQGLSLERLRPFFSMVQPESELHREMMLSMRSELPNLLETTIPYSSDIERMGTYREPVFCYPGGGHAASAYERLCDEMCRLRAA